MFEIGSFSATFVTKSSSNFTKLHFGCVELKVKINELKEISLPSQDRPDRPALAN